MTRPSLRWSAQARRDIASIRNYLKENSGPLTSARVIALLLKVVRTLPEAPLAWEARPEWGRDRRRALSNPYVII